MNMIFAKGRNGAFGIAVALTSGLFLSITGGSALAQTSVDVKLRQLLPESIQASNVIKVGSPRQDPPNVYMESGQLVGTAPEVLALVAPILGVKMDWQEIQWPGLLPAVQSGRIDVATEVVNDLADREKSFFIVPYINSSFGVVVPKGNPHKIARAIDLCGLRVGGPTGSIQTKSLTDMAEKCASIGKPPVTVLNYPGTGPGLVALSSGNLDAFCSSNAILNASARASNGEIEVVQLPEFGGEFKGHAVARTNRGLADALAGALKIVVSKPEYKAALAKFDDAVDALTADQIVVNPYKFGAKK